MPKSIPEIGSTSKSEPSKIKSPEKKKVYTYVPVKPINNKSKNIGLLSKRQLKDKICEVSNKEKMPTPKRNRNGKMGINKETNCKFIPNAPTKTCFTCGNSNHLAIDCRESKKKVKTIPKSDIRNRSMFYKPEKSCFHCGSKWHSIYTCNVLGPEVFVEGGGVEYKPYKFLDCRNFKNNKNTKQNSSKIRFIKLERCYKYKVCKQLN